MILECPECRSRYLIPDSAIGVDGRTVRCANCRHSWFQEPAVLDLVEAAAPPPPPMRPATFLPPPVSPEPSLPPQMERSDRHDFSDNAGDDRQPIATQGDWQSPTIPFYVPGQPIAPISGVPFDEAVGEPVVRNRSRPRRNPARRWTIMAIVAGLLMLAAAAAILWSGAPGLASRLGLALGPAETPLRLRDNPIERRELENGSELFAVSGQVTNPSDTRQRVPDIRAELRDEKGKIVYSWTITPERRTLAPGAAIDFNSAKLDVPGTSRRLELSFAGEG